MEKNKRGMNCLELNAKLSGLEKNDMNARRELVEAYMYIVFELANSSTYSLAPADKDELISSGFLGLLKGVDTFKNQESKNFIKHITMEIKKAMDDACKPDIWSDFISLETIRERELKKNYSRNIVDTEKLYNERVERNNILVQIYNIIENLQPKHQEIIKLYFGITSDSPKSADEIAAILNLPKDYVEGVIRICVTSIKNVIGIDGRIKLYSTSSINNELLRFSVKYL